MGVLDPSWPQGGAPVLMRIRAGAGSARGHGCLFLRQPSAYLCGSLSSPSPWLLDLTQEE